MGYVAVTIMGLALMVLSASAATEQVGQLLFGPVMFFVGWLLVSGVVWLALKSATSFLASKYPASPAGLSFVAALAMGSGVQSLMFYLPYASASMTWEPESAVLVTLIQMFSFSGVVLVTAGLFLTLTSMLRRFKDPTLSH